VEASLLAPTLVLWCPFQPRSPLSEKIFSPENPASTALVQPFASPAKNPTKTFSKIYLAR
jgi:hypothetical protein